MNPLIPALIIKGLGFAYLGLAFAFIIKLIKGNLIVKQKVRKW